jgi:hypothetical protein
MRFDSPFLVNDQKVGNGNVDEPKIRQNNVTQSENTAIRND